MSTLLTTIVADFRTSLATEIGVGGTSVTLQSATDDDGVALPAGKYYLTVDRENSVKEYFYCDLSGTAITNIKSVSRQGVQTVGAARKHRIGASVVITDFASLLYQNNLLTGTTPLDSANPLKYDGVATISDSAHLATKKYVDDTAVAGAPEASETVKGIVELATSTETQAGTSAGATGARLVLPNSLVNAVSAGAADVGKVPAAGASGTIDQSWLNSNRTVGAVYSFTADNLQVTTDADSANDATRKSFVDALVLGSGIAGENIAAGDAIGAKILSTGANLGSSTTGTSVNWTNPNNVFGAGNTTNITNPTAVLRVLGFSFAVPATATITGIEVTVNVAGTTLSTDNSIRLVKAGVASGTAKTLGGVNTSLEDKLYGSRFDLWGNTLTYTDVNSATFGVDLNFNNAGTITIDYVRINVYYTDDTLYKSSAADTNGFLVSGFAKATVTAGNTVQFTLANSVITGAGLVPGKNIYLSDTAGAVSQTAGTKEVILGKAITTTSWLYEGKKSFISGTLTAIVTQLVHRQVNFGFKARNIKVWTDINGNSNNISVSSRSMLAITAVAGSPPYADVSGTFGWSANGGQAAGTITLTDDGFLAVPTAATAQGILYYEAYD